MKRIPICLLLAALIPAAADAALAPEQKAAAEGFIRQFSAPEFEARQKAVDGLVALGADVVPLVLETLAATPDNEVKLRCEMVLKGLGVKSGAASGGAAAVVRRIQPADDAAKITLDLKDATLAEALDLLAQQSGNARIDPRNLKDRPVTVAVKDTPYWQALDRICEQAEVVFVPPWYRGVEPTMTAAKSKEPTLAAYAGPAVLYVDRVTRTTTSQKTVGTRTDLSGARMPVQRTLSVAMRLFAEDRLNAAGCAIRYTKAVSADGKDILPKYYATAPVSGSSQGLSIPDTEEGIKGPLAIEGFMRVNFYSGVRERRADDVFAAKQTVGDEELLLRDVVATRRNNKSVQVSLSLTGEPSRVALVTYDMPRGYGFILVDPDGKRYTTIAGWSRQGSDTTLDFANAPEIAGKWSLLLVVPERVDTKEYPFALKDIPLP